MPVSSVIANSGGDFSSIAAWESWAQGQFGSAPDEYIGEIRNDFPGNIAGADISGWGTTDATNHATLTMEAGSEHGGVFGAITAINGRCQIQQPYTVFDGLAGEYPEPNFGGYTYIDFQASGNNGTIKNCLIRQTGTTSSASQVLRFTGADCVAQNVAIIGVNLGSTMRAILINGAAGAQILNCTVVSQSGGYGSGVQVSSPSATMVLTNVVSYGNTVSDFNNIVSVTNSNLASGDSTAIGTSPLTGVVEADFTDFANDNLVPATGNQLDGANNPGVDLSGTFTDDVAGNLRSVPWERGAYEIAGAGPSPIEVQLTQAVEVNAALAWGVQNPNAVQLTQSAEVDSALAWGVQNPNAVQLTQSSEVDSALPWVIGGVYFNGPDIVSQTGVQNQVFTFNENGEGTVDSRFTPATTTYLLSPDSGPLPAGLSVNATTGNLEGTPTEVGTFSNIIIRGSDGQTGFSPEVQAVLTRMSSLSQTEIDAIEAFVDGLVADGIWQNLDEFYCFALNATDWLTGWKAFTATTSGNVTRTANGASCNNDESHIDAGIDLSTLTHYQATDCGIGAFVHTVPSATTLNRDGFGVSDATSTVRWRHRGSDTNDSDCTLNGTMTITVAQPVPISGEFVSMNDDGATVRVYIDAVEVGSDTTDGVIPSGQNCYIFRWNDNGTPDRPSITGTVITDFYVGAQVNVTQMLSRLQALHTALGVVI